jgi:tRNA1(Val) A37 N6-methylase TrmN6
VALIQGELLMERSFAFPLHETPRDIAAVLARHAPRRIDSILDPAVGYGSLIEPLLGRIDKTGKRVTCIDNNMECVEHVERKFRPILGSKLETSHCDFLEWSSLPACGDSNGFDCIVMNPPFLGRSHNWVRMDIKAEFPNVDLRPRHMPVEAAFFLKAIKLLKQGGRLLAVVPSSLISSNRAVWLREIIVRLGAVRFVYQLPNYAFKKVEGRAYLLIYVKDARQGDIVLKSVKQGTQNRIVATRGCLTSEMRFDFSFHSAQRWYKSSRRATSGVGWTKMRELADVYRGKVDSPFGVSHAVHTCHYKNGFWRNGIGERVLIRDASANGIKHGDLLMMRVGRRCGQSLGVAIGLEGYGCSDCVFIIRPKRRTWKLKVLLGLRLLIGSPEGAKLVEMGTGASYLTQSNLLNLEIPMELSKIRKGIYRKYVRAVRNKRVDVMEAIEGSVREVCGFTEFSLG